MGTRKQFTPEFKCEAVQLVESGSRSASELPASWGSDASNAINGSGNSRPEVRGRSPARGREKNERPRSPPEPRAGTGHGGAGHCKKSVGVLRQGYAVRYGFMQTYQQEFRITRMCAVLHVSRSGFCAWQRRQPSSRTQANQRLIARMRVLHQQTREAYGARKMWQLLTCEGLVCGRHLVARLRRVMWIMDLHRRRSVRTVQRRQHEIPAIPNRLNQQFAVSAKNRVWAGDLTFVPTRTGWLTVAVLLDLYSRRIVGWAMSSWQTLSVVVEVWWMA